MIIECKSCHARFRLDESKIRGKGARVKCRKCGDGIIVLRDQDTGIVSQEPGGEGSLDLGSVLRESSGDAPDVTLPPPPNNLIPFPGATKPPDAAERREKDEVDLVFDQMLAEPGDLPASGPPVSNEPPAATSGNGAAPQELPGEFLAAPEAFPSPEAGAPVDVPLEFAPEETLQLPPLPPDGSGSEAEVPQDRAEDGFLISDAETLDILSGAYKESERGQGADISSAIASAPIELDTPLQHEFEATALPPAADVVAPPPEDLPLEGNVTPEAGEQTMEPPPYGESSPAAAAHRPQSPAPSMEPSPGSAPPSPRSAPARSFIAGGVLVVVLLAVGAYFGLTASGRKSLEGLAPRIAALLGGKGSAASGSRYEVKNVIGYYESGAASPRILVIKGQVINRSTVGKSGIRVHAALLDGNELVLGEKAVYAGNMLSGAKLKTGDREALEKSLANPLGDRLSNMDVPPGKTVPFMVLFFDAPDNIDSYRLEARDNE
jgi:predicted Zn finger-like uncharacterized protein